MKYIWKHIEAIINSYDGGLPLTHFLKHYYKQYPVLGSRDRKVLSEMAYSWYRCEKGLEKALPFEEKVQASLLLCGNNNKYIQPFLITENAIGEIAFNLQALFPFQIPVSAGINTDAWLKSMLSQPRMFIRMRRNQEQIMDTLRENNIPFEWLYGLCLSLPNGTNVEKLLPEKSYVVQDASSQYTVNYMYPLTSVRKQKELWWDCCAGAGGKSLMIKDSNNAIHFTVSDVRASILHNLSGRFKLYFNETPVQHIVDVTDEVQLTKAIGGKRFDNIICDVPCSGSGTWARTPEQLYFFKPETIRQFAERQKTIAVNASAYLKPGGKMFYITCSIFKEENEDVVKELVKKTGLELTQQQLINGIENRADSMFISVLKK